MAEESIKPVARKSIWVREQLLHLLSLSGTLAGLCITGVALFRTTGRSSLPSTVAYDLLAVSSSLFLICTHAIFIGLRTRREALAANCFSPGKRSTISVVVHGPLRSTSRIERRVIEAKVSTLEWST